MAVTETPPETAETAADPTPAAARPAPTGLAAVLGSGDHKVVGRLYVVTALVLGVPLLVLGTLFGVERIGTDSVDVFGEGTVFQFFTLLRVGTVFLLALPLAIGVAVVVVPLQVGARSIAFPRAAAASYWGWLLGSLLLLASYLMNGGPGGGSGSGVNLWIASMGMLILSLLLAAVCLATTVIALRTPGLTLDRAPMYAWSVAVASVMWILTLPVLFGLLVLIYVDHRHAGGVGPGNNAEMFNRVTWFFRNPQIYVVAIPVLGFAADVLGTTARARLTPRLAVQFAVVAFGVLGFGAFLAGADASDLESPVVIAMGLLGVLPVLAVLALIGDLFRRGSFRLTTGAVYAVAALVVLLHGVVGGAIGSLPGLDTPGTVFDLGVQHALVLASLIGSLGGLHWWAVKIGRQAATESLGKVAPLVLLVGSALVVIPDLVSGLVGEDAELAPDWTGGLSGLNAVTALGFALVLLGVAVAIASYVPLLKTADDVPVDPWDGQTLEWLAPSPPPLANFEADLPVVTSAEPLVDQRQEK